MEYISPSKLKAFRACPYQQKHDKFVDTPSTLYGKVEHYALAEWASGKDFLKAFSVGAKKFEINEAEKLQDAKDALEFAESLNIPLDGVLTIESEDGDVTFYGNKYFQVPFSKNWGIRGAMDLVYVKDGILHILDWKSGFIEETDDIQLLMYALSAWKKYPGFKRIKCIYAYTRQKRTYITEWDEETLVAGLEYLRGEVQKFVEAQKARKYPQTPHEWCKYCGLKDTCKAYQDQLKQTVTEAEYNIEATPENLEKIIELYEKMKAIEKAAEDAKKTLQEKYEKILEGAPQTINGRVFAVRESPSSYDYNLEMIFNGVSEVIGRAPLEICKYYASGLKEVVKDLEKDQKKQIDELVKASREVKGRTKRLSVSIAKETEENEN